jgi:transposase-like protein
LLKPNDLDIIRGRENYQIKREVEIEMSNRTYSPEFKAKIVLEILKEEKHISEIAS